MNALRRILLCVVMAAQLAWLGYDYVLYTDELEQAPRILVEQKSSFNGSLEWMILSLADENPVLGKSLWWGDDWLQVTSDQSNAATDALVFSPRPDPGEAVTGAYRIQVPCSRHFRTKVIDADGFRRPDVVALWSRGEEGVWRFRLEAAGSSEDVLREGECRTWARMTLKDIARGDDGALYVRFNVVPYFHSLRAAQRGVQVSSYPAAGKLKQVYRECEKRDHRPQVTLELALRKNKPLVITQVYFDGMPLREALERMKQGRYPQPEAQHKKVRAGASSSLTNASGCDRLGLL